MKILITGGCGFLGSNLCHFFLNKRAEVINIDSLFREGSQENLKWLKEEYPSQFLFFKEDIAKKEKIEIIFKDKGPFDYIIHVAGQVAMTSSLKDPERDFKTNTLGTFNLLEATRKFSSQALFAYSSTNKVYGDLEHLNYLENNTRYFLDDFPTGFDESLQLDFSTPYGCSKGAADQYVRDWGRVYKLKTVVFRHSSIYGGRQFASVDQGWIGWFCKKAIEQKKNFNFLSKEDFFSISGSGKQVRDVLHADDLIDLYWLAYLNKEKLNGEIFNIGGGINNSLSLLELFNELCKQLNLNQLLFNKLKRRTSDQNCFIADIGKAKEILHWNPKINYREGLEKMIYWTESIF